MKLIVLAILSLSIQALASVTSITCPVIEKGKTVTVSFKINNLMQIRVKPELVNAGQYEEEGPVQVEPLITNGKYSALSALNDQGGDLRVGQDKLILFGDGAGYTFVDLVLFRNSGFKKGYVRVYGSGDRWYRVINCEVSTR
jgi:hypothetical protein